MGIEVTMSDQVEQELLERVTSARADAARLAVEAHTVVGDARETTAALRTCRRARWEARYEDSFRRHLRRLPWLELRED